MFLQMLTLPSTFLYLLRDRANRNLSGQKKQSVQKSYVFKKNEIVSDEVIQHTVAQC